MSVQVLKLINGSIIKQEPYLELGNCGLVDNDFVREGAVDKLLRQATHLRTLVLSNGFYDIDGDWISSQNIGKPNSLSIIPSCVSELKELKHFFCTGSYRNKFGISDLSPLSGLTNLIWIDLNNNEIQSVRQMQKLSSLKVLNLSYNRIRDLDGIENFKHLTNLDLSYNQIEEIKEISQLTQLDTLQLNNNWIKSIKELGSLCSLKTLNISRNKIQSLHGLEKMSNLTFLDLQYNRIQNLYSLRPIKSLHTLDLRYNQITSLSGLESSSSLVNLNIRNNYLGSLKGFTAPQSLELLNIRENRVENLDELAKVEALEHLDAGGNLLTSIRGIKNGGKLKYLDLSYNSISDLTALSELKLLEYLDVSNNSIGSTRGLKKLLNLNELFLQNNKISSISEIKALFNLKYINAGNNLIDSIDGIKQLHNLSKLILNNNQINSLSGIDGLQLLDELDVSNNEIEVLDDVGKLMSLNSFNVNNNKVSDVSSLRLFFDKFDVNRLKIKGNPLTSPPAEILELGNDAVRNYFNELDKQGVEYLFEAKLLIVGQPRAGKTSLRLKLFDVNAPLPLEEETTRGIDINRIAFDTVDNQGIKRNFYYNVWDFGGQQIYQATHQFFLTHRSLYILVVDAGKDGDETTLNYWLQALELFGGKSPLLLIRNEKNERQIHIDMPLKQSRFEFIKKDYGLDLNALIKDSLDFKESRLKEFQHFKEDVETELKRLPLVGFAMPKNWVKIRNELQQLGVTHYYITRNEFEAICCRYNVTEFEKQMELSRIFHDLGVFLHFQDYSALEDFIILQNTWATDAVFAVLDDIGIQNNKGKFLKSSICHIWKEKGYDPGIHNKLLALMMQFELCYKIDQIGTEVYIVPEMLSDLPPEGYQWGADFDLPLQYRYDFMPKGILTRLIVRVHKHITTFKNRQIVWKTGVSIEGSTLDCPNTVAEITEAWNSRQLYIRIQGPFAKDLMNKITYQIDELNREFFRQTDSEENTNKSRWYKMIPCNCIICLQNNTNKHFYDYNDLLKRKEFGKETIECKEPPFEPVYISALIDGVFANEKDDTPKIEKKSDKKIKINKKTITIFLASSSELEEERNRFEIFIGRENKYLNDKGVFLKLEIWEDFLDTMSSTRLQDNYNTVIQQCDIFVMLYFTKVGKYTEEEFEKAFKQFKETNKPLIYTYFKQAPIQSTDLRRQDVLSLLAFQEKLSSLGHFQTVFENHTGLHLHFKNQLQKLLIY